MSRIVNGEIKIKYNLLIFKGNIFWNYNFFKIKNTKTLLIILVDKWTWLDMRTFIFESMFMSNIYKYLWALS